MIERKQVSVIGRVNKTHGVRGELSVTISADVDPADLRCIVFDIDSILVPFFISSSRTKGTESWLICIDGIDTDDKAAPFVGKDIMALKDDSAISSTSEDGEEGVFLEDLVGWKAFTTDGHCLGTISAVDDSTVNYLLVITPDDDKSDILVPAVDEFIEQLNPDRHSVTLSLPSELIQLND